MFASLSRGGARFGKPYICSSCLSGLLAHSDPQFAHLAGQRVLQIAPFSATRHNGKTEGKQNGDEDIKPSTVAGVGEGAVNLFKSFEDSSKSLLKRMKALTSSKSTTEEGTGEGIQEGESGAVPKMSQFKKRRLRKQKRKVERMEMAKKVAEETPTESNTPLSSPKDQKKATPPPESNKEGKQATKSKKATGDEPITKSIDAAQHPKDGTQDEELMTALSTLSAKFKSKKMPPPKPGRKKGKAVVNPSPPVKLNKAPKLAAAKKIKPATKEANKPGGDFPLTPVAKIGDQVSKMGEDEARNTLISAIQGGRKKHRSDGNQGKDHSKKASQSRVEKGKAKIQPSDAAQDEVLKNLRKSVTSKLPSKLTSSKQRSSMKLAQTIKDAMQKPSLRKIRSRAPPPPKNIIRTVKSRTPARQGFDKMEAAEVETISAANLKLVPVNEGEIKVPSLSYGLERVLFNPGVYQLQDPRSRVFNFDPYLQTIMPVSEFDFTLLKKFITSSRDTTLLSTAKAEGKKYTGSTSSMTSALSHFHYLLSQWRKINPGILSKNFPVDFDNFTLLQRAPTALFLRYRDGTYAIDADKEYDTANVLSMLGQSMEKLLTLSTDEFEQYRKHSADPPSEEARNKSESYHYTTMGDFLMRSQLDAHDPRIPGTGMFDLKTRAVISIRMDTTEYKHGSGYEIRDRHGEWESYEREYYDMIRAAFLKYSLQVRMGRMDGIFVAFHNTERIFGFQYISLPEMDYALHGSDDTTTGDSEFKLSLSLLNRVLDRATTKFPEKSLRLFVETRARKSEAETPYMYIFAEPVEEKIIEEIQNSNKDKIEEFERTVLGIHAETEAEEKSQWESLQAQIEARTKQDEDDEDERGGAIEGTEDEIEDDVVSREMEEEIDRHQHDNMEELLPETEHVLSEEVIDEDARNEDQDNEVKEESGEIEGQTEGMSETEENSKDQDIDGESFTKSDELAEIEPTEIPMHMSEDGSQTAKDAALEEGAPLSQTAKDKIRFSGRPILAMYLTVRNKVNGRYVKRPSELKKDDDWKVEYALANIPGHLKAHRLQEASKARRAKALTKNRRENAWNQRYIENIRKLSKKGRNYRKQVDKMEKNLPVKVLEGVVYGRGSNDPASPGKADREVWTEDGRKKE